MAAVALRLFRIGHQSLWLDEATQLLADTRRTPLQVVHAATSGLDRNLPLYPLYHFALWIWLHLGPAATAGYARVPSAIASASVVPATWLIARRLAPRSQLLAATLMVGSPFAIYYGQEARMYALAGALAAWSVVAFLGALDRPERGARWALYAFLRLLAFYTHPYTVALTLPELVVAFRRGRSCRRAALVAWAGIAAGMLPWAVAAWSLRHSAAGLAKPLAPIDLGYAGFALLFGYSLGPSVAQLHEGVVWSSVLPVILAPAAAVAVVLAAWMKRGHERGLVAGYAASGLGAAFAIALVSHATFNVRYGIAALPFVLMIVAEGLVALRTQATRAAVAAVLCACAVISLVNSWTNPAYAKEDFRDASAFIGRSYRSGDEVVLITAPFAFTVYAGPTVPTVSLYKDGSLDPAAWATLRQRGLRAGTVWVVRARPWEVDPHGDVLRWALSRGNLTGRFHGPGIDVYRLSVAPDPRQPMSVASRGVDGG